jgi:Cof subfamily protein (haloacid dehalogenase superfamily)
LQPNQWYSGCHFYTLDTNRKYRDNKKRYREFKLWYRDLIKWGLDFKKDARDPKKKDRDPEKWGLDPKKDTRDHKKRGRDTQKSVPFGAKKGEYMAEDKTEKFIVKMIITDLDGTLLNDDKNISDYTLSVLKKCKNNGIKIGIATARSDRSGKRIIDMVNPDIMILNDGALIKNETNKIIYKKLLSRKTSDGIINECVNNSNAGGIGVETEKDLYYEYKKPFDSDWDGTKYNFKEPLSQETYKISAEIFTEDFALYINNKYDECKLTCNSGECWYRFTHRETGKMPAVEIVSKDQNIPLSDIVVFGDDYNDIEMIKKCGTGVAMENGIDEVKSAVKYICGGNNNDGVGKWIEKHLL